MQKVMPTNLVHWVAMDKLSSIIYQPNDGDYPTNYFYQPVQYMIWGGVPIYDIKNPSLRKAHKIYSFLLLAVFAYGYIITEIIHVFKHLNELEELTLTMCYLIAHFIAIGKVIVLTIRREQIGKFLTSLEEGVFLPDIERGGDTENSIINEAVLQTHTQAKIFGVAVVSMISSRVIPFLLKTPETIFDEVTNTTKALVLFPYPSTIPFIDAEKSPYFQISFFYQTFSMTLFGWYLGNSDTIITGLMIHVKAQFKIVTNAVLTVAERAQRMTDMDSDILNDVYETDKNGIEIIHQYEGKFAQNLKICVKNCIKHHYAILNLLENLENTFSQLLLTQFLGSLTSLCVGLYQTSLLPITNPSFISMSSFTIAMFFQLLIYCWNGNELSLYSVEVAKAAFNSRWIQSDRDVKMSLSLIMLRAQRVSSLTAGKFSKISLETFTTILRGSVSYFMVLRKVNEDVDLNKI